MRYFKCENYESMVDPSLRKRYAHLLKEEKRLKVKEKWCSRLGTIVFFMVWLALYIGCRDLISLLFPSSESMFEEILNAIFSVALHIFAILIAAVPALFAAIPLWSKKSASLRAKKQAILSMTCANLRDFYSLQEPCIVTKCYDASDKRFKNHDVCLFVAGDELRITANLLNGFFYREKDLGCYAFSRGELSVSSLHTEKLQMTQLRAGETVFHLAVRAEQFIGKHFPQ